MQKHHTEDYKISAVKHYLNKSHNLTKTCNEFDCSRISLKRWINRYNDEQSIKRHNIKPISYKVTKEQVKYAIQLLKQNEQINLSELGKLVKENLKIIKNKLLKNKFIFIFKQYNAVKRRIIQKRTR